MIRGKFKLSLLVTIDGSTVNDTLSKAAVVAQYLEEHNIAVAFDKVESLVPERVSVWVPTVPEMKIQAIKEVRHFLNIGLKEAKDFVEGDRIELSYTEAERFKIAMAMCGLTIEFAAHPDYVRG
jgi:ribosomal protein L7/L12